MEKLKNMLTVFFSGKKKMLAERKQLENVLIENEKLKKTLNEKQIDENVLSLLRMKYIKMETLNFVEFLINNIFVFSVQELNMELVQKILEKIAEEQYSVLNDGNISDVQNVVGGVIMLYNECFITNNHEKIEKNKKNLIISSARLLFPLEFENHTNSDLYELLLKTPTLKKKII